MKSKLLSVVIPTYNRPELLIKLVDQILNKLPEWAELIVLNNASTNFAGVKEKYDEDLFNNRFTIITHKLNVCGDENILRSFEVANGKWVWVIGDDDEIYDNSFDIIKDTLTSYENTDVFHVHFNWEQGKTYLNTNPTTSFKELFSSFHSLGDFNFISSGIFKVDVVGDYIYWAHFFQSSGTPLTAVALLGLDRGIGSIALSNNKIVNNGFLSEGKTNFWDVELVLKNLSTLAAYPFDSNNKKVVIDYLLENYYSIWMGIKSAVREYSKGQSVKHCIQSYNEVLKIKLVYGNIFSRISISIIELLLYVFIKPINMIFLYLKKRGKRF